MEIFNTSLAQGFKMNTSCKRKFDFSIEAILQMTCAKKHKTENTVIDDPYTIGTTTGELCVNN